VCNTSAYFCNMTRTMFQRDVAIKQTVMMRRYRLNSRGGGKQGMLAAYVQTQATNRKSQFKREEASD
jgi:hypothetical protein